MKKYISIILVLFFCTTASAKWKYKSSEDEMGRGTLVLATTRSTNTVNFNFPYSGKQRATLAVRNHPTEGTDIIVTIVKGQFLCSMGCNLLVKFDNKEPTLFSASAPSSHDSTLVFLSNDLDFLSKLKKSKKIRIQAEFYSEGNKVFKFNTKGFSAKRLAPRIETKIQAATRKLEYYLANPDKIPKTNKGSQSHSHSGRKHSHPLPAQGKAHKHGNGAIGR